MSLDNPGLVGSDNESYGGKILGGQNRASDTSLQSSNSPDIHPFFKVSSYAEDLKYLTKD